MSYPGYPGGQSPYGGGQAPYGYAPYPGAGAGAPSPFPATAGGKPSAPAAAPTPVAYPAAPYQPSPFASLVPPAFPAGTDPNIVACFQMADQDGSGFVDDKELQKALSSYNQSFSLRTVHLLMFLFTNSNAKKIGAKEFTSLFYSLQSWRGIFERFDRDRSGKIDAYELREALLSLGFAVSPAVLDLLISKYDKSGKTRAIDYDNFIEYGLPLSLAPTMDQSFFPLHSTLIVHFFSGNEWCSLIVKGLTEKFKEKDTAYCGSSTFTYEAFMLAVLPFIIA
ncbi:hypothetical protein AMTRI_Chr12g234760 [Amborella trichopoda]